MLASAGMPSFDARPCNDNTRRRRYSTKTSSVGAFDSHLIELIIIAGMIVGSLPFVHYLALTLATGKIYGMIHGLNGLWLMAAVIGLITIDLNKDGYG